MKTPAFAHQGGKVRMRKWLIDRFPTEGRIYCEPFAGKANVYFEARKHLSFDHWQLNDINLTFLQSLRLCNPHSFPIDPDFNLLRDDESSTARVLEPKLSFCGKGYQAGKGNVKCYDRDRYRLNAKKAQVLLRQARLSSTSWDQIKWNSLQEHDFVYLDPPYLKCNQVSIPYENIDHEALVRMLNQAKFKWALSGYSNPIYRKHLQYENLYIFRRYVGLRTFQSKKSKVVNEMLWTNF